MVPPDALGAAPPVAAPDGPVPARATSWRRARTLVARLGFALALVALAGYLAATALLVVPVEVPRVQDCGAPGAYLLSGRVDVIPDGQGRVLGPDDEPLPLPASVADAARNMPCRDRVADRAVPAGALIVASTAVGLVAAVMSLLRPRAATRVGDGTPHAQ